MNNVDKLLSKMQKHTQLLTTDQCTGFCEVSQWHVKLKSENVRCYCLSTPNVVQKDRQKKHWETMRNVAIKN